MATSNTGLGGAPQRLCAILLRQRPFAACIDERDLPRFAKADDRRARGVSAAGRRALCVENGC